MPARVTITKIMESVVSTTLAKSKASFLVLRVRYSVNTGIKAMVRDPSAKSRRKRLGIRNATKKASAAIPEPKSAAKTISRTRPRIRL